MIPIMASKVVLRNMSRRRSQSEADRDLVMGRALSHRSEAKDTHRQRDKPDKRQKGVILVAVFLSPHTGLRRPSSQSTRNMTQTSDTPQKSRTQVFNASTVTTDIMLMSALAVR